MTTLSNVIPMPSRIGRASRSFADRSSPALVSNVVQLARAPRVQPSTIELIARGWESSMGVAISFSSWQLSLMAIALSAAAEHQGGSPG